MEIPPKQFVRSRTHLIHNPLKLAKVPLEKQRMRREAIVFVFFYIIPRRLDDPARPSTHIILSRCLNFFMNSIAVGSQLS
jgi:hypothetical protein